MFDAVVCFGTVWVASLLVCLIRLCNVSEFAWTRQTWICGKTQPTLHAGGIAVERARGMYDFGESSY